MEDETTARPYERLVVTTSWPCGSHPLALEGHLYPANPAKTTCLYGVWFTIAHIHLTLTNKIPYGTAFSISPRFPNSQKSLLCAVRCAIAANPLEKSGAKHLILVFFVII
jgi:hypothetical protein